MSDLSAWARSIGESIRMFRSYRGLTQSQLAGDVFSKSYISQLERGTVIPSIRALSMLAERLDLSLPVLLESSNRPSIRWLKKGTTLYYLGDFAASKSYLELAAPYTKTADSWELCEYHLLAARLAGSTGEWQTALQHCSEMEEILKEKEYRPARLTVPQNYWWGKSWLLIGNQHQAVRRWEAGMSALIPLTSPPTDEGLRLLYELSELYIALGDPLTARDVTTHLEKTLDQLVSITDLSRWILLRTVAQDPSDPPVDPFMPFEDIQSIHDAEAWARAGTTLQQASKLRTKISRRS